MNTYQWDFSFLAKYQSVLLEGMLNTMQLSLVVIVFGLIIGCLIAALRISKNEIFNWLGTWYVELFRNVPALVILFWFYYALPVLVGVQNNQFLTASVAFSLYTGSYFAEIIRSGIQSVPKGQWEVAMALGFGKTSTFVDLILPQAFKKVLPSLANEVIEVVKISAVAATIALPELLSKAKLITDTEYRPVEAYTVVAILMIGFALVLSLGSYYLEHRFKRFD